MKTLLLTQRRVFCLFAIGLACLSFSLPAFAFEWFEVADIPKAGAVYRLSHTNNHVLIGVKQEGVIALIQSSVLTRNTDQIIVFKESEFSRTLVLKATENPSLKNEFSLKTLAINDQSTATNDTNLFKQIALQLHQLFSKWHHAKHTERLAIIEELKAVQLKVVRLPQRLQTSFPFLPKLIAGLLFEQYQAQAALDYVASLMNDGIQLNQSEAFEINYVKASALMHLAEYERAFPVLDSVLSVPYELVQQKHKYQYLDLLTQKGLLRIMQGSFSDDANLMHLGLDDIKRALDLLPIDDVKARAIFLNKKATYYAIRSSMDTRTNTMQNLAETSYQASIDLHYQSGSTRQLDDPLNNYSHIKSAQQKPLEALAMLRLALSIADPSMPDTRKDVFYHGIGMTYEELGDYQNALTYLQQAAFYWKESTHSHYYYNALLAISALHRKLGQFDLSESVINKVNNGYEEPLTPYQIKLSIEQAYIALHKQEIERAWGYLTLAESLITETTHEPIKLMFRQLKLYLCFVTENKTCFLQESHSFIEYLSQKDKFAIQRLNVHKLRAEWFYAKKELVNLELELNIALDIVESLNKEIINNEKSLYWRSINNELIGLYMALMYEQFQTKAELQYVDKAFRAWERFNALSMISKRSKPAQSNIQTSLKEIQEAVWKQELKSLVNPDNDDLLSKIELDSKRFRLQQSESKHIHVEALGASSMANFSLDMAQSLLTKEQKVIGSFVDGKQIYYLIIGVDSVEFLRVEQNESIENSILEFISKVHLSNSNPSALFKEIEGLFPFERVLEANVKELIFIANDSSQLIPINALIKQHFGKLKELPSIVNTFSFRYFFKEIEVPTRVSTKISIFAAPNFGAPTSTKVASRSTDSSIHMADLPWSAKEAQWISEIFDGQVSTYTNNEATSDTLISDEMRLSNIQHIATHAITFTELPYINGLATANKEPGQYLNFDFVSLSRLLAYPTASDLVVLSGCETMLGTVFAGEGPLSLSRAMLQNGAGGTIGSLWPVADRPTSIFMKHFYQHLKSSQGDVAASLSYAQEALSNNPRYRHPKYWSAFVFTAANQHFKKIAMY